MQARKMTSLSKVGPESSKSSSKLKTGISKRNSRAARMMTKTTPKARMLVTQGTVPSEIPSTKLCIWELTAKKEEKEQQS